MDSSPLRRRVLAAIASAAGLVALPMAGCGTTDEPKQTYTDGGEPISVPTSSCTGQSEVQCFTPESLPRIDQGNRPIDPDAAPPPPPPEPPRDANRCVPTGFVQNGCCNAAVAGPVFDGKACCYRFCTGSCCGRPLIVEGAARIAAITARDDWAASADKLLTAALDDATRSALADAWLADAQVEHASIASFARFTLDLLAHGAPPDLVVASQRASLDEVTHARLGFAIASRLAGRALGPGRMELSGALASPTLAAAAAAAVREGCIGETVAAMLAQEQHRAATDEQVRASLGTIARDEARHAELAWRFVAWAIRQGDPDVRAAVEAAFRAGLAAIPLPAPPPHAIDLAVWTAFGRPTAEQARAVGEAAVREVLGPCARALLA